MFFQLLKFPCIIGWIFTWNTSIRKKFKYISPILYSNIIYLLLLSTFTNMLIKIKDSHQLNLCVGLLNVHSCNIGWKMRTNYALILKEKRRKTRLLYTFRTSPEPSQNRHKVNEYKSPSSKSLEKPHFACQDRAQFKRTYYTREFCNCLVKIKF